MSVFVAAVHHYEQQELVMI